MSNGSKHFDITDTSNINVEEVFLDHMIGTKKYLLKEDLNKLDDDRKHLFKLVKYFI